MNRITGEPVSAGLTCQPKKLAVMERITSLAGVREGEKEMHKDSRVILDERLEVHTDGTVFKIRPDGSRVEACITLNNNTRQAIVCLREDGKQKAYSVNRLIAQAFIPNPENKPYVSYRDGNPANNHVDNLSWITKTEQVVKAKRTLKKKERNCGICGNPTLSEDGICASCKRVEKMEETRKQNEINTLERIRKEFETINLDDLTYLQRQTVEMRLQGMSYEEIGSIMGCSRQCVEHRLKAVLKKSEMMNIPGKHTRKAHMLALNKLIKSVIF